MFSGDSAIFLRFFKLFVGVFFPATGPLANLWSVLRKRRQRPFFPWRFQGAGGRKILRVLPRIMAGQPTVKLDAHEFAGSTLKSYHPKRKEIFQPIIFLIGCRWLILEAMMVATEIFFHVHPDPWGNDPIWRLRILFNWVGGEKPPTSHLEQRLCFRYRFFESKKAA